MYTREAIGSKEALVGEELCYEAQRRLVKGVIALECGGCLLLDRLVWFPCGVCAGHGKLYVGVLL